MGEAGHLHILRDDAPTSQKIDRVVKSLPKSDPKPDMDWEGITIECFGRMTPESTAHLAAELGLKTMSLQRMNVGWEDRKEAHTIPMVDADQNFCGVQLRFPADKKKRYITGSTIGIFCPYDISGDGILLVCEGASDTMAMLDHGFDAVGRSNCKAKPDTLIGWLKQGPRRDVAIIADNDPEGIQGATILGRQIRWHTKTCRVVRPSVFRDARAWSKRASRSQMVEVIVNAFTL
jgi:hypothetical protein